MFDAIILLTGPEEQPVLAGWLRQHRPRLQIHPAVTAADVDALKPSLLAGARLVAFATHVIVPATVLRALSGGAYNFHPGPPHYPGWAPAQFAIYDGAAVFGATAHLMVERVDAGPIVGVETFAVPPDATVHSLECLGYTALARLFQLLAKALATQSQPLPELGIPWSGRKGTRRSYVEMCEIPLDISKEEFDRRMQAFGGDHFGITHTINLHGRRFRLLPTDENRDDALTPQKCQFGSTALADHIDGVAESVE